MKNKDDKSKICVFVASEYAQLFPNFESLYRTRAGDEIIVFDCISAVDMGNYLDIVAVNQKLPEMVPGSNIWIPSRYVLSVLVHSDDKVQMGFLPSQQENTNLNQGDHQR